MHKLTEQEVIDRLRVSFPESEIGDDTAVLPAPKGQLLFTADAMAEGIHFDLRFSTLGQAVEKLITSNVSDIYAMGGAPGAVLVTAGLAKGCSIAKVEEIIEGLGRACRFYGLRLAGGDTVCNPTGYFFNAAVLGSVEKGRAVRRSGAQDGDLIVLFGSCGGSAAGLRLVELITGDSAADRSGTDFTLPAGTDRAKLRDILPELHLDIDDGTLDEIARRAKLGSGAADVLSLCRQYLCPRAAPLAHTLLAVDPPVVTAMIDVSDGIARDLVTLCRETAVGAAVDIEALPAHPAIGGAFSGSREAQRELELSSGEEYALLATIRPEARELLPHHAAIIGEIVTDRLDVTIRGRDGSREPLPGTGYEHTF
jgi:thiamine-monophosphate kinase